MDKAGVRLEDKTYGSTNGGLRSASIGEAPYYPTGPPVTITLLYPMRGLHPNPAIGWVYWSVNNNPDLTGAYSGYPGVLSLITHDPPLYIP